MGFWLKMSSIMGSRTELTDWSSHCLLCSRVSLAPVRSGYPLDSMRGNIRIQNLAQYIIMQREESSRLGQDTDKTRGRRDIPPTQVALFHSLARSERFRLARKSECWSRRALRRESGLRHWRHLSVSLVVARLLLRVLGLGLSVTLIVSLGVVVLLRCRLRILLVLRRRRETLSVRSEWFHRVYVKALACRVDSHRSGLLNDGSTLDDKAVCMQVVQNVIIEGSGALSHRFVALKFADGANDTRVLHLFVLVQACFVSLFSVEKAALLQDVPVIAGGVLDFVLEAGRLSVHFRGDFVMLNLTRVQ